MNIDDDCDDDYGGSDFDAEGSKNINGQGESKEDFDLLNITDPRNAYFFLSDDAQDELNGTDKRKMRCLSCGHKFIGEIYDGCPECFSPDTEEIVPGIDDEDV